VCRYQYNTVSSVVDPDPDLWDTYDLGLPDPHPDTKIQIRTKMSRIHNTDCFIGLFPNKNVLLQIRIRHIQVTSSGPGLDMDPGEVPDL
jgi:hypothetical protein